MLLIQFPDDHEIYEALRRVHLLPDHVDEATVLENPFADLDTFVAVGKSARGKARRW
jgi:hypothetical protein